MCVLMSHIISHSQTCLRDRSRDKKKWFAKAGCRITQVNYNEKSALGGGKG